jgi:hypothetical protein
MSGAHSKRRHHRSRRNIPQRRRRELSARGGAGERIPQEAPSSEFNAVMYCCGTLEILHCGATHTSLHLYQCATMSYARPICSTRYILPSFSTRSSSPTFSSKSTWLSPENKRSTSSSSRPLVSGKKRNIIGTHNALSTAKMM